MSPKLRLAAESRIMQTVTCRSTDTHAQAMVSYLGLLLVDLGFAVLELL